MLSIDFLIVSLAYPNFLGTKRLCVVFYNGFFRKVMLITCQLTLGCGGNIKLGSEWVFRYKFIIQSATF